MGLKKILLFAIIAFTNIKSTEIEFATSIEDTKMTIEYLNRAGEVLRSYQVKCQERGSLNTITVSIKNEFLKLRVSVASSLGNYFLFLTKERIESEKIEKICLDYYDTSKRFIDIWVKKQGNARFEKLIK